MECKSCGYNLDDDAKVCPNCGAETAEQEEKITEEASFAENEAVDEKPHDNSASEEPGFVDDEQEHNFENNDEEITDEISEKYDYTQESEPVYSAESDFDGENEEKPHNADSQEYEEFDVYEDGEFENGEEIQKVKLPKAFKIAAAIILVIVIAAGGTLGYLSAYNRPLYSKILSAVGLQAGSSQELNVYTAKEGNAYNIYAVDSKGNTKLLITSEEQKRFSLNTNFVAGNKNIFYLNDETLFAYSVGDKEPVQVSEGVSARSLVLSPSQNKVLYVTVEDGKSILHSYVKGKKTENIGEIKSATLSNGAPAYGFDFKSDSIWYINADVSAEEGETVNGELYYKEGKKEPVLLRKDVAGIEYINYAKSVYNIVYSSNSGENDSLYMISAGKEIADVQPKTISKNYVGQGVIPLQKQNAVVYIDFEGGIDETSGSVEGTMYLQPFSGDASVIDTGVGAIQKAQQLFGQLYSVYDYSTDLTENDAILYLKGDQIGISYDGQPAAKAADDSNFLFDGKSSIEISKDSKTIAYMNENALEYSVYDGKKFSAGTKVADGVVAYKMSADGKYIAYIIAEETNPTGVLWLYNIKDGSAVTVSENAAAQFYFTADSKTLLYTEGYNEETQVSDLKYYKNGANELISKDITQFIVAPSGTPYIIKNVNNQEQYMGLYKLNDKNEEIKIFDKVSSFNFY